MKSLVDAFGIEHDTVEIYNLPGLEVINDRQQIETASCLTCYRVDGKDVSPDEFFRLFPVLKELR